MKNTEKTKEQLIEEIKKLSSSLAGAKKVKAALRESEQRLSDIINFLPDATFVIDLEGKVIAWNRAIEMMTGIKADAMLGRGGYEYSLPFYGTRRPILIDLVLSSDDDLEKKYSFLKKDGDTLLAEVGLSFKGKGYRDLWAKAGPIYDGNGKIVGAIESIRDITDQKTAEKELKESKKMFQSLVETTSDWIWELDQDSKYTYSSPKIKDLLGYTPEYLIGKTPFVFMPPEQAEHTATLFKNFMQTKKPFKGLECTCLTNNGLPVIIEKNGVPIFDSDETLIGYRGIARDISKRKKAEKALKKSHYQLSRSLDETVTSLSLTAEHRDPYTAGHQHRVDTLACAIAQELGMNKKQLEGLHIAATLHDIGKIALPSEYLSKPTILSAEERAIIKCHSEVGHDILKNIHFPWPVAEIVYQHHELLDGSGYPRGLTDQQILLEAKILTVADIVEAMSSHRPYRPSLGIESALQEIRSGRGTKYHTESVDACLSVVKQNKLDMFSGVS